MVTTRSNRKLAESKSPEAGEKRKAEEITAPEEKPHEANKEQKTIEETLKPTSNTNGSDKNAQSQPTSKEPTSKEPTSKEPASGEPASEEPTSKEQASDEPASQDVEMKEAPEPEKQKETNGQAENDKREHEEARSKEADKANDSTKPEATDREAPSNILEKGIMYFFARPRVNVSAASSVSDIQRSYLLLRPISNDASLPSADIPSGKEAFRVIAIPKKALPSSPKDRFMIFVQQAKANVDDLKKTLLAGDEYETKAGGHRTQEASRPIAEGIYAITSIKEDRETHLAYSLTLPEDGPSQVQKDVGLEAKGSFVISAKNPKYSGPAGAQLPESPKFSEEIMNKFGTLRWRPVLPEMLNYENAQLLLIGTKDGDLKKATGLEEEEKRDAEGDGKATEDEIEKLEEEDEKRISALEGDDAVFKDLDLNKEKYKGFQVEW